MKVFALMYLNHDYYIIFFDLEWMPSFIYTLINILNLGVECPSHITYESRRLLQGICST